MNKLASFVEKRAQARRVVKSLPKHLADAHRALQAAKQMPSETAGDAIFKAQARIEALSKQQEESKGIAGKQLINKTIKMEPVSHNDQGLPPRKLTQVGYIGGVDDITTERAIEQMVCLDLVPADIGSGFALFKAN